MPHPLSAGHEPGASFLDSDGSDAASFRILCEIEPPTRPDIELVRDQIATLSPVCDAFLVPDNHLGRATVSSIAVAHEVGHLGGRSIACINARDRNLLGLRRDLLTASAYGVDHFLLVHGDDPTAGERSGGLNVRAMLDEVRANTMAPAGGFRAGAVARVGLPLAPWKRRADFLVVQLSFDVDALVEWRATLDFDGPVFAGVLVLASAAMAQRLTATIGIDIPAAVTAALATDPLAGVGIAIDQLAALRASGAVAGAHLVPARRYKETAAALAVQH
jgi:5,10-methylenetetrahydrofolate reductase